ncbi:hypothetical protein ACLB2K_058577 [Fragaria x ananassa]
MLRGSLPIPSPLISYYSVSNNEYAGEIPAAFCNTWPLCILDLSNNNLNGKIPPCFENLRFLQLLKLQNNSFHGAIPQIGLKRCLWLRGIDMSDNQLQGKLPRSIANCSKLMFLNFGNNQISDTFPSWLGKLQKLKVLMLRSNAFHGIIGKPTSSNEFPELSIIDLSSNDFSGILPSNYIENWNAMKSVNANQEIYVQSMFFFGTYLQTFYYDYPITVFSKGVELKYIKTPYLMRLIDLSSNRFVGEISGIIGNLRGLNVLNLCNNTLSGPIPSSFGNLIALESLDLSQNQLSGKIPIDLAQLTFLAYFNVSNNRLYGHIPQGRRFDTFQEDMYQGNSGLCGKPLSKKCKISESFEEDEDSGFQVEIDWFMVLPGVVAGLIVGVIGGNFWTAKKHEWFVDTFSRRRRQAKPLLYFALLLFNNPACSTSFVQRQMLCCEEERSALLQFKASLTTNTTASSDPLAYPKVASWDSPEGDPQRSNCCSWDGIECNEDSGHVIGLDLASSCLYGSINSSSSLFQLVKLQRLDLSDNNFSFSEIPSRLGHDLTSLTYLNLSTSSFSGQIPSEMSYLSKLSALDLSSNYENHLKMPNFRSLVQNLTNIKQLHLSLVEISSTVPSTLVNLSSLTSLRLQACNLEGNFPVGIFHLPNLQVLDLAYNNNLTGYFPEDLNMSSPLKTLNLPSTNFSGHLPDSIGNLRALNLLNISSCHFYPLVPSSLSNLTQLNLLDLSSFYDYSYRPYLPSIHTFSGQLSDSWSGIGKLTKLYILVLQDTNLRGDLPSSLANLTQLLELDLSQNQISGEIPCFLANLTQLSKLRLGYNQISGQIPSCLEQLNQLTLLDLRFNHLQGTIPRSLFQLTSLEYIFLNSNKLSGYVEFDEISKLKKLRGLRLSLNKLSVQIKTGFTAIPPKINLLELGSCNLTEFPEFLKYTSELMHLDLSDNNLHGQIPKWMWNSTSESLRYLNLSHNHLTGFEENPVIIPWHQLSSLQLDSNMLRGSLPVPAPSIEVYSISNNGYTGEIPATFCNARTLNILDLSNNNLNGMIPQCFENFGALQILKLRNNSFHGDIPQICLNPSMELAAIDLSYNQLQGKLPKSIANCPQLMFLNLGNNQISDTFPAWLGVLQQLRVLILRSNAFHGIIGKPTSSHEFPLLSIVDLSSNNFSGMLPSDYLENWNAMKSVDENEQIYVQSAIIFGMYPDTFRYDYPITVFSKGVELKYFKTPYLLRLIDLSSNRFEGQIPALIGNLRALHLLNLSNNTLTGPIPSSFGNLTAVESLDLSQNQLSGKIPSDLAQLTFLAYFNVSHNLLYGPIPQGRQFDTFQENMYQGNSGLCGKPLSKKCEDSETTTPQTPTFEQEEDSGFQIELDWYVILPGAVTGLIVGVWLGKTFGQPRSITGLWRHLAGVRREAQGERGESELGPYLFHTDKSADSWVVTIFNFTMSRVFFVQHVQLKNLEASAAELISNQI